MADLTVEQYGELPEFLKEDYKEVDGVYKHAGMMKVKQTANELDGKLRAKDADFSALSDKLTVFEQKEADAIKAKADKALDSAKSSGDVEAILKQKAEQMADLEKRTAEKVRAETLSEVAKERAEERAKSEAKLIASDLAVDGAQEDLNLLVERRIKADEQGNIIYLNVDGSASSMDKKALIDDIKARHKWLIKPTIVTTGGGFANGNSGSGGSTAKENKSAETAKKNGDSLGFLNAHFKEALKR